MAVTAFTGPPGAGKSHALMKDVLVPAIMNGRRVLTNIDGVDADAVRAYCLERIDDVAQLGELLTFDGSDALKPGFFPDEATGDQVTTVKGGDLVVFDEWALTFPRRGNLPQGCNVEGFLRWHRHLNGADGSATDVAIGTQLASDVHQNFRGLIVKSYKFRKLTALGADRQYTWQLFEGHLQPKGGHYKTGTGTYDKAVFPLYASSAAAKEGKHVELRTNKKESIWSGWKAWAAIVAPVVLILGGSLGLWASYGTTEPVAAQALATAPGAPPGSPVALAPIAAAPTSPWRIVGQIDGDEGVRVIVTDEKGGVRMLKPDGFNFDQGRAVSGMVDGQTTVAEDRPAMNAPSTGSPFGGILQ
jgi:zona occludens toxin